MNAGVLLTTLALVWPEVAMAHAPPWGGPENFYSGLLHPLYVPAHALAVAGIGLLAGQQAMRWQLVAVSAYVIGLMVGFAAMVAAFAPLMTGEILLATAAATGVLTALARPLPEFLGALLGLATGTALALDSPPSVISLSAANVILIGTSCGATVLLIVIIRLAAALRREWQRIGLRILGSWIAASAMMVLALRLAR